MKKSTPPTLDLLGAISTFRWDPIHDYATRKLDAKGRLIGITRVGLYEEDLNYLKDRMPGYKFTERSRVEHSHGTWLRVDIEEDNAQ